MKTLIYSDVHGNLPAFEKMLKAEADCEVFVCLGDLVNYGPWSNECVDLALSLPNSINLLGNHEEAFINGKYPGENVLVQDFFKTTFKDFSKFAEIATFQVETRIDKYKCKHTIFDKYIYPDTSVTLDDNYIIGHSHHQFKYVNGGFDLYNAGSVGQNRKFINEINYLVYNVENKKIEMKSMIYNIAFILEAMYSLSYPQHCINYYALKARR